VENLIAPILLNHSAEPLADAARVRIGTGQVAFTADSFVVSPLRFPGGSIGHLAVNGTANDLAVSGARPEALVVTLIVEAGLASQTLEAEIQAIADAALEAGVSIVGGDTKVVEHGKADVLYITTAGIGQPLAGLALSPFSVRPGDKILLSGPIGDHGITILLARGELEMEAQLASDTRCVFPMVEALAQAAGPSLRWMRDPTRGGVATSLNELARDAGVGIVLEEHEVPVREAVRGACELLGLDPLHIANEGQFLAVVAPESADTALDALRKSPGGRDASIIGEVCDQPAATVLCHSGFGGTRVIDMLVGDPLPRIC
jgi:hydrogenase expression/formation protein HypE